ncbi:MAG TPA: hypothetical protein VGL98_01330 [Gammaproteobacteria bacterium]
MTQLRAITALTSAIICGSAIAQDEAQRDNRNVALELTMTLIPANAKTPAAVTAIIELPKESRGDDIPATRVVGPGAHGLDTANAARDDRVFGQAAAARDNREAAGRASRSIGDNAADEAPRRR